MNRITIVTNIVDIDVLADMYEDVVNHYHAKAQGFNTLWQEVWVDRDSNLTATQYHTNVIIDEVDSDALSDFNALEHSMKVKYGTQGKLFKLIMESVM